MKCVWLAIAVLSVAGLSGCEADESAPRHSARDGRNLLTPDEKAKNNAEQRELEKPGRELPTGGGAEFPGQSAAPARHPAVAAAGQPSVVTLAAVGPDSALYPFTICPRHKAPAPPATLIVPETGMDIPPDWGTVGALPEYRHRAWTDTKVYYESGDTKHNPRYFEDATTWKTGVASGNYERGTLPSNPLYDLMDVPWFYGNVLALPVLMCIDCPWGQRTTSVHWDRPVFNGALPPEGAIAPTPVEGTIHWEYPKPAVYPVTPAPDTVTKP